MSGAQTLCYVMAGALAPQQTTFVTPPETPLQAGYVVHAAGHEIPRHTHRPIERRITGTSEMLMVRKGRCAVDIYNDQQELIATRELGVGDFVLFVTGGHGFRMLEDTVLLELKQGPYPGVEEKERF